MYRDRADAGRRLAERLGHLRAPETVVLGLPRGGVAVGFEVALALGAPLVVNREVLQSSGVAAHDFVAVERAEHVELERRAAAYRGDRTRVALQGRTAIIVDDGVATGSTARAAGQVARASGGARIVLAVPVGPRTIERDFAGVAAEGVCPATAQ